MEKVLLLYKPLGMTPLQCITLFKEQHPTYQESKLSYAGRLDPMAEGLLLVLVCEENKKRGTYENLTKEYECEVLFGLTTDTYDILGKLTSYTNAPVKFEEHKLQQMLKNTVGTYEQPYPPYSSQPINGKPLYYWARQNRLDEIAIPTKSIEIYSSKLLSHTIIDVKTLQTLIHERIAKVTGDFRQKEILATWGDFFNQTLLLSLPVITITVSCSSGTYIRSLANRIGRELGCGGMALSITRTQIGNYTISKALSVS